jgi:uncharacterized protein
MLRDVGLLARSVSLCLAMSWTVAGVGCSRGSTDAPTSPSPLRVKINERSWKVSVMSTRFGRYRGLSGRSSLPEDEGMLFVFPRAAQRAFCMRGCHIPIDIAFLGPDFRIVSMHTMTVEPDRAGRKAYPSEQPAQFALEVGAGQLAKAGAHVGQTVAVVGDLPDPAKAEPSP